MSFPTMVLIAVIFFIPTAWAIVHIAYRDFVSIQKKALWGLVVVFLPPLGGIVYLVAYQLKKAREKSKGSSENEGNGIKKQEN